MNYIFLIKEAEKLQSLLYLGRDFAEKSTMASHTSLLEESTFHNWLKSALAVLIAKEGTEQMVIDEMVDLQSDLLQHIYTNYKVPVGTVCSECTTENVLHCKTHGFCTHGRTCTLHHETNPSKRPGKTCPKQLCQHLRDGIRKYHRGIPSWKVTDATHWCTDPFQLAKCFMPPEGYKDVSSIKETDFNGVVSVIINCKLFDKKFADNLSTETNVCSEARNVARKTRHSPDLEVSDSKFEAYICKLVDFLSDTGYLATNGNAKAAVSKLKKLKEDKLNISSTSLPNVIDGITGHMTPARTDTEGAMLAILKEIKEESLVRNMTLNDVFGRFKEKMCIFQINNYKLVINNYFGPSDSDRLVQQDFIRKVSALQEDLVVFYENEHKAIPVAPLFPSHDAKVLDFYVKPSMEISQWNITGRLSHGVPKIHVASYSDIFKNDSSLCHDIYITANAGNGKTTFAKRLCLIWCHAKGGRRISYSNIQNHESEMLGFFTFLFFIPLREVRDKCELDDIIHTQVISKLLRHKQYPLEFLKDILQAENCLVILEGLDEWFHPDCETGPCDNPSPIPHRKARDRCTILSTTRISKLHQAKLKNSMVDKYIEITELGNESKKQLIHNVVLSFTGTDRRVESAINFIEDVSQKGVSELASSPIILIQLLCLWHDGKTTGKTLCDIYLNIIELLLQLREERHGQSPFLAPANSRNKYKPPQSLNKYEYCEKYYELLISVGKLAFTGSFSSRHEACSLVYESSLVRNILSEEEILCCLQMGLLTEKTANEVSRKQVSNYSFNHKTYEEFFAALYIQEYSKSETVLKSCPNFETILSMRYVLIFLSGLNSEEFSVLSQKLNDVISDFCFTRNFRRIDTLMNMDLIENQRLLKQYQDINISCAKECGKDRNTLYLDDLFMDENVKKEEHCRFLKALVDMNRKRIKSLTIADLKADIFRRSIDIFQINEMNSLEKVFIRSEFDEQDLDVLLTPSVKSLKCIRVISSIWKEGCSIRRHISLSEPCCNAIQNMPNLVSLVMEYLILSHMQLETLVTWVERKVNMNQVGLSGIKCKDHGETCPGVALDLSRHSLLESLVLELSPISDIRINTTSLQECSIGECSAKQVFSKMLKFLETANNLRAVQYYHLKPPDVIEESLITLQNLTRLVSLELHEIDLGDRDLELSESIRCIYLNDMKMSTVILENLLTRVKKLTKPIRIDIWNCHITPNGSFQKLKDNIHSSNDFSVLNDWSTNFDSLFSFQTKTAEDDD